MDLESRHARPDRDGRPLPPGVFSSWHLATFVLVWLGFAALTFLALMNGLDDASRRPWLVAASTAGSLLGPMTGAICRDFQGCCLACSLSLLPWCLSALAVSAWLQFALNSKNEWLRVLRYVVWAVGVVAWFGGGILSLGHALS